jgi:hypothetical protein
MLLFFYHYSYKIDISGPNKGPVPVSFVQVLEHSLNLEQNTQAWCNNCAKYQQHVSLILGYDQLKYNSQVGHVMGKMYDQCMIN